MALPVIPTASRTIHLPLANTTATIHAWRVGDEKLLLAAAQSNTAVDIQETFIHLLESVMQTDTPVTALQIADVEYAFLQIRALSIDDTITRRYECQTPTNTGICKEILTIKIPIASATIEPNVGLPPVLNFDTTDHVIRLTMRQPTIGDTAFAPPDNRTDFDAIQPFLQRLISHITIDDDVFNPTDDTPEDWQRFFDSLQRPHLEQLEAFIHSIPRLVVHANLSCPKCGMQTQLTFRGIRDLFF